MKIIMDIDVQEANRLFEGLSIRRIELRAGVNGEGNMVSSRSQDDYIALSERMLVSLESVSDKFHDAWNAQFDHVEEAPITSDATPLDTE
jgi:hypothetical protein